MKKNPKKFIFLIFIAIILIAIFVVYISYGKQNNSPTFPYVKHVQKQEQPQPPEDLFAKNIKELFKIVDDQDPHAALAELQHRMDTDPYVFKNCHAMAHEIGHEAMKKYKDFNTALQYQDITCSDGYLHGIIEGTLESKYTDVSTLIAQMQRLCDGLKNDAGRCYHGVGHGMMYYTDNDLPRALALCEHYAGSNRGRCYEGAFMENFLSDAALHPSKYLNPKDPMYPCKQEAGRYKSYCYFYAPYYFLRLNNNDFKAAIAWCSTAERGYDATCVRGVGSIAMKFNLRDPKYVESICDAATSSTEPSCISGMASYYLIFNYHASKASEMCTSLEPKNQAECNNAVKLKPTKFFVD